MSIKSIVDLRDKFHVQMANRYPELSLKRDNCGEYYNQATRDMWIGFMLCYLVVRADK